MNNLSTNKCRLNTALLNRVETGSIRSVMQQCRNNKPGLVYYTGIIDIINGVYHAVLDSALDLSGVKRDFSG